MKVTVVGQGYVGLPLATASSEAGFMVFGLDNNEEKIALLKSGKSIIEDLSDILIKKCIDSKLYIPTISRKVVHSPRAFSKLKGCLEEVGGQKKPRLKK